MHHSATGARDELPAANEWNIVEANRAVDLGLRHAELGDLGTNRIRLRGESGIGMAAKDGCVPRLSLQLRAAPPSAAILRAELKGWLERLGVATAKIFDLTLAASEALTIISNSSPGPVAALVVTVEGKLDAEQMTVTIRSYGLCRPEPVHHEETLGHLLLQALTHSVEVESHADGQTITLYERLQRSTNPAQIE